MADLTNKVIGKEGIAWECLAAFRERHGGIKQQALDYAIKNDKVDFIKIGAKARAILLTKKTLEYSPNPSPSRNKN